MLHNNKNAKYRKSGNKNRSPYKQSLKNRRNISIKQSWDKASFSHKNSQATDKITTNSKGAILGQTLYQVNKRLNYYTLIDLFNYSWN